MKLSTSALRTFFNRLLIGALATLAWIHGVPSVEAQVVGDPPVVVYNPTFKGIQGLLLGTSQSFSVDIFSPNNLPASSSVTVSFANTVVPGGLPVGANPATALSYVTFSPSQLTFTGPEQKKTVTITVAVPLGGIVGDYGYQWSTTGWPVDPNLGNDGSSINVTVTSVATPNIPVVTILTPVDNSTRTVQVGGLPIDLPFQFTATANGTAADIITTVDGNFEGANVTLTSVTGLNTLSVTGSGTLHVTTAGVHTVTATATNHGGLGSDLNTFTIVAPLPTIVINTPAAGSTATIKAPSSSTTVTLGFTATSNAGGVRTLTATLDGVLVLPVINGIGSPTATGSVDLPFSTAGVGLQSVGPHVVVVTTTDDSGTVKATSNFTVSYLAPTPTVVISNPGTATITLPSGSTTTNIPFAFNTGTSAGFTVDSVSATLDGTTVPITTTTGLGTTAATSSGTLASVGAGTHTLMANGMSAGIPATASVTFTVASSAVLPTVVINTPPVGSVYTRITGGAAVSFQLSFTGTSNTTGNVIKKLTASLDGSPLTVASTTIGQKVATGTSTISVSTAGTHTITVSAVDAAGTATASRTFLVTVVTPRSVCGTIFFDVNYNGVFDHGQRCDNDDDNDHWSCGNDDDDDNDRHSCNNDGDFGLVGITVKLLNSANQVVATTISDSHGSYCFGSVVPGAYVVSASAFTGLKATTLSDVAITVANSNITVPAIGFGLDFNAIRTMTASGLTLNYWKGNLDKANAGKAGGQVSASKLRDYTKTIGDLALTPYDDISMKSAGTLLGASGSKVGDVLSRNLLAAEYNYSSGAYIGGNRSLTFLFVWWGEYVSNNPSRYTSTYTTWTKNWFDAYNKSNGGKVAGPSS